jgi:hypothetical protein
MVMMHSLGWREELAAARHGLRPSQSNDSAANANVND